MADLTRPGACGCAARPTTDQQHAEHVAKHVAEHAVAALKRRITRVEKQRAHRRAGARSRQLGADNQLDSEALGRDTLGRKITPG